MDEPLGHPNAVGVFQVSQLAHGKVKVLLSGEGADELFAGYYRYSELLQADVLRRHVPNLLRYVPDCLIPMTRLKRAAAFVRGSYQGGIGQNILAGTQFCTPEVVNSLLGQKDAVGQGSARRMDLLGRLRHLDPLAACQLYDILTYLPPLLVRQDKMSMAASIENRVPFVTPTMFRFAMSLPAPLRATLYSRKVLLRRAALGYLPRDVVTRPKMGFGIPLHQWLRGPLKAWAQELLDEKRLKREGFFEPSQITVRWREHLSGRRNWHYSLWVILMFQAWRERWM